MDDNELKRRLEEIAKKIGPERVCIALQVEGLSPRQSEVISFGQHKGKFRRRTVAAVNAVIAKQLKKARAS